MGVEESYPALRDEPLQLLVRAESEVHVVGVRADEHVLLGEDEVHRLGELLVLILLRHRGEPRRSPPSVDLVYPHHALHGVDALPGDKARGLEEKRADAAQEIAFRILGEYRFT